MKNRGNEHFVPVVFSNLSVSLNISTSRHGKGGEEPQSRSNSTSSIEGTMEISVRLTHCHKEEVTQAQKKVKSFSCTVQASE